MVDRRSERRHQVQALAAGQLGQRFQPFMPQHPAQRQRGLDHKFPVDPLARIEIEDEPVGVLDVLDARVPRVQLDRANLEQAEQAGEIIDPEPRAFAAFASRW